MKTGIRAQGQRIRVTPKISHLGYPRLSERGNFVAGDGLIPQLVTVLIAVSYSLQCI